MKYWNSTKTGYTNQPRQKNCRAIAKFYL